MSNQKSDERVLFICGTTLQLAIACAIVEKEQLTNRYDLLFLGNPAIQRKHYYLERLQKQGCKVIYFHQAMLKSRYSWHLKRQADELAKRLGHQNKVSSDPAYGRVLLSNTYNKFYGFLLSSLKFRAINTFDDGIDNINSESLFYQKRRENPIKWGVQYLFGRRYWQEQIMAQSRMHYTLYRDYKNIVTPLTEISLVDLALIPSLTSGKTIHLFLGSPYRDICSPNQRDHKKELLLSALQKVINQYGITHYIPHPGDETPYFQNVEHLIPNKMAEAIITDYLYQGHQVVLYGFGGTTQFNFYATPNLDNYVFYDERLLSRKINHCTKEICNHQFTKIDLADYH